jgi:hypothetical protein
MKNAMGNSCVQCGSVFSYRPKKKYCSPTCQRKHYWANNKERLLQNHLVWTRKNKKHVTAIQIKYLHNDMQRHPWHSLIRSSRKRAAANGILHNLDFAWGKERWTGFCEITGIEFDLPDKRFGHKNRNFFPSIDRIKPELGYTKDNCRFVLWAVNVFKGDGTDADMYEIAEAIVDNRRIIHIRP